MIYEQACCDESGLKISVEIKYPDGEYQKTEITSNKWDANGDEMREILRKLLAALGFAEKTIDEIFGDDCVCYEDMLPPMDEPAVDDIPCCWECKDCTESCEDTACLHEEEY